MDAPAPLHYDYNPLTGEYRTPCNGRKPKTADATDVLDLVSCPACRIAIVHAATTGYRPATP